VTAPRQIALISARAGVAKLLSFFGLSMMLIAIGYGLYELKTVNDAITEKKDELIELRGQIDPIKEEIDHIRNAPLSELVTAKAIAILRPGLRDERGRQLFNFIVWLDLPYVRKADIKEVEYVFGDESFLRNRHTSSESSNGFAVGYLGWGAMTLVPITIVQNQGPDVTLRFRMSEEIKFVTD
jgi:hypothetical protein